MAKYFNSVTGQFEDDGKGESITQSLMASLGLGEQAPEPPRAQAVSNPVVREYLAQKIKVPSPPPPPTSEMPALEEVPKVDPLAELKGKVSDKNDSLRHWQLLANLGDVIAKRPGASNAAFDKMREANNAQIEQFMKDKDRVKLEAEESDLSSPDSPTSKSYQVLAKKMLPSQDFSALSAKQIMKQLPSLEKIYSVTESNRARAMDRSIDLSNKAKEKDEKKNASMYELEGRRKNIESNVKRLQEMINKGGTFDVLGSHNAVMEGIVSEIATDMAKLQDPESVARPGEVENVKKTLIEPTLWTRNSTAKDILKKFQDRVKERSEEAYKIRGLEMPKDDTPPSNTKVIGGKTYRKVTGGWEEVD